MLFTSNPYLAAYVAISLSAANRAALIHYSAAVESGIVFG